MTRTTIKLNATEDNRLVTIISIIREYNPSMQNEFGCQNNMTDYKMVSSPTEPSVYDQRSFLQNVLLNV